MTKEINCWFCNKIEVIKDGVILYIPPYIFREMGGINEIKFIDRLMRCGLNVEQGKCWTTLDTTLKITKKGE